MATNETKIRLKASPEARLILSTGDQRHLDFHLKVDDRRAPASPAASQRPPIRLALVLDRSGSMSRGKLDTAKMAALQVLERLTDRDQAAVVVFDDRIDVLSSTVALTAPAREAIRARLGGVEARGSTALHEGWLTGAQAIADDGNEHKGSPARVLLLTDGLANVGKTDPEEIATEAAQVHSRAGIATSTFGIGDDYDEGLLGPMAVAGGGQFHHLRQAAEIITTFSGELGALLDTAATQVSLELEVGLGTEIALVSAYWLDKTSPNTMTVRIGDLPASEERHVVVSATFPPGAVQTDREVRARVTWTDKAGVQQGEWQTVRFTYADAAAVEAQAHDAEVAHWAGLHLGARARQDASYLRRQGLAAQAGARLRDTRDVLRRSARVAPQMAPIAAELDSLAEEMEKCAFSSHELKEMTFRNQNVRRGQRDLRDGDRSNKK